MGTGYTRNDTSNNIDSGKTARASDIDGEFDALESAFATTGHTHDGTAAEGGPVTVVGPAQDYVAGASDFSPKTDSAYDLGTTSVRWANGYFDALDSTALTGTLTGNVTGDLTGNVTGDLTGNVTGNLTGNVTGGLTGNADTATALETARNIQISGEVTGTASFNGTSNINIVTTPANSYLPTTTDITAGSGISVSGTNLGSGLTVSHSNTSSQASVNNSGGTVIQDITVDTYGHVTSIGSYDLDNRFYQESDTPTFSSLTFDADGTSASPVIVRSGDTNTGFYRASDGVWGYSRNGSRTYRFSSNTGGTDTDGPDGVLTKNIGNSLYQTISSLTYKDNVTTIGDRQAFWSMDPDQLFVEFDYGGDLPVDHPLFGAHKVGYNLDYLGVVFPESLKFGEFLDPVPLLAMVHQEVQWMRPKIRQELQALKTELNATKDLLQQTRQQANQEINSLKARLDAAGL